MNAKEKASQYFDHYYQKCFENSYATKGNEIESILMAKKLAIRLAYIMVDFSEETDPDLIEFYKEVEKEINLI